MKFSHYLCLAFVALAPFTMDAKSKAIALEPYKELIEFSNLNAEICQQITLGELPQLVLEVKAGTEFPAKFMGTSEYFSFSLDPRLTIKMEKTYYFRFILIQVDKVQVYLSSDLVNWFKAGKFERGAFVTVSVNEGQVLIQSNIHIPSDENNEEDNEEDI